MEIIKIPDIETVENGIRIDEPMIAAISFDGKTAVLSTLDYGFEHNILIAHAGYSQADIDKFFRIIFDRKGADWTFICPPNYKKIPLKSYRLKAFYKDGFSAISDFLSEVGYCVSINIPDRYRRHFDMMTDENAPL
jgi:hypothetical protein